MFEQERVRQMIQFRFSPLLDMALSLLILQNPERFSNVGPWADRVTRQLPAGLLDSLRDLGDRIDLFGLAQELEEGHAVPTPELLRRWQSEHPEDGRSLLAYWEALAPEVGARAAMLVESIRQEQTRLSQSDPLAFICHFSDRVSVAGDGEAIVLHWGKGMQVPLADLTRILFVPSAFSPRRLMFYRLGPVQIFFYNPLHEEPVEAEEAPESLVLGLSALSDPTRLRLLRLIAREGLPAQEMARRLDLNESTVSRHLRLLVEAGLVGRERMEGKFIMYTLHTDRIDGVAATLKQFLGRDRL